MASQEVEVVKFNPQVDIHFSLYRPYSIPKIKKIWMPELFWAISYFPFLESGEEFTWK